MDDQLEANAGMTRRAFLKAVTAEKVCRGNVLKLVKRRHG